MAFFFFFFSLRNWSWSYRWQGLQVTNYAKYHFTYGWWQFQCRYVGQTYWGEEASVPGNKIYKISIDWPAPHGLQSIPTMVEKQGLSLSPTDEGTYRVCCARYLSHIHRWANRKPIKWNHSAQLSSLTHSSQSTVFCDIYTELPIIYSPKKEIRKELRKVGKFAIVCRFSII